MTVQKNLVKNIYVGNGSTTQFPITFDVNTEHPEYIHVYIGAAEESSTETDNYEVDLSAKKVTYPKEGTPLATGQKIIIVRQLPLNQLLDLINQGDFFADDIERAFDDNIMIAQQLNERLSRAVVMDVSVDGANFNTTLQLKPGKAIKINEAGTGFELTEDPAKVLPQAQNLLQQTTEQANIATNKANAAAESAVSAANSEDKAQAWAESTTSPDGKAGSKSAKTWASEAANDAETVQQIKEDLQDLHGVTGVATTEQLQSGTDNTTIVTPAGLTTARPLKTYTSPQQLGLNLHTFTWQQLYDALPANSLLVTSVNPSSASDLYNPNLDLPNLGHLFVVKGNGTNWAMQVFLFPGSALPISSIQIGNFANGVFYGWKKIATNDILPVGTILPFAGGTIPNGFLACNGAGISATTYAELYAVIGNTYGGNSTTFNLPKIEDNRFLEFSSTRGVNKNAGLPNLIGAVSRLPMSMLEGQETFFSGVFEKSTAPVTLWTATGSGQSNIIGAGTLKFAAADNNNIYGGSTTVQPKSLTVRAIIKY